MWSAGFEAQVYLTQQGAWVRTKRHDAACRLQADGWPAALAAVKQPLAAVQGRHRTVRFWLSAALARPFMLEAIAGLKDRHEALRMASAQAPEATGLPGACTVWLDAWKPGQACLAVAVEQRLIDAVMALAAEAQFRVKGIAPAWNAALSQQGKKAHDKALPKGAQVMQEVMQVSAVIEDDALTALGMLDGRVVFTQATAPAPAPDRLQAQLQRLALSRDVAANDMLLGRVVGLNAEPNGRRAHDLVAVQWHQGLAT